MTPFRKKKDGTIEFIRITKQMGGVDPLYPENPKEITRVTSFVILHRPC